MKHLFVPLTKVDAEHRLVYGTAAVEQLDKSGEVFDYETSKPLFQTWSGEAEKLSLAAVQTFGKDAVSFGNVREMHGKSAAGKLAQSIVFKDDDRSLEVCAKIVDDAAWAKVQSGVYTGFSIGGSYAKLWDDPTLKHGNKAAKRYTAQPAEISLVDNPCMPGATFTVVKGAESELRKFTTVVLTAEEIPAASARVCVELSASRVAKGSAAAAAHGSALLLVKRAQELGVDVSGFATAYLQEFGGVVVKGMYNVIDVARSLMDLNYCRLSLEDEAVREADGSPIPGRLKEIVQNLSTLLVDLATEETSELTAAKAAADEIGKETIQLKKIIEQHKTSVAKLLASTDPEVVALGKALQAESQTAEPQTAEPVDIGELRKVYDVQLTKLATDNTALLAGQTELTKQVGNLAEAFNTLLKNLPALPTVGIHAVEKGKDVANPETPAEIDPKDPEAASKMMKMIHAGGAGPVGLVVRK